MKNGGFLKVILAATAGASLGSLVLLIVFVAISGSDGFMWREISFMLSCNALFCGVFWWPFSKIKKANNPRFDALAGALLSLFGWFALPISLLKRADYEQVESRLHLFGKLSYALPLIVFLGFPEMSTQPAMIPAPELALTHDAPLPSATAPNVLLVVADTLRADVVLDANVPTPNMDALRERGTWAEYAVAPCDQTLPSHLVLLTGFDIERIGMRANMSRWPSTELLADNKCMPVAERFQLAGYNTAAVATNMLLSSVNEEAGHQGFADGFNTWHGITYEKPFEDMLLTLGKHTLMGQILPKRIVTFPFNRLLYPNDIKHYLPHLKEGERTTDSTIAYIEQLRQDERPYFVLAQYLDPHSPYIAPDPLRGSIARSDSRPSGYGSNPEDEYFMRIMLRKYCRAGETPADFEPLANYLVDLYLEEVVYFDQQLGRLLEQLKNDDRETIVVFVSDHGEGFGEHGNVEHGNTLYNEEILVPFVIAGPGVPESNELGYAPDLIDATFTMLDLAGVSTANVDGQSVVDNNYEVRPAISFMIDHVAVFAGDYKMHAKLVYPEDDQPYQLTPLLLFDLSNDADEKINIIEQHPEVIAAMEKTVAQRMENDMYPHISERELTAKQQEWLGALGYTD
ncbi:MAG TPA: hypothetical protein EYN86_06285 [Planctomycetes bacterium]|nr:hypothetical protein [Planctomycetota bacterium]